MTSDDRTTSTPTRTGPGPRVLAAALVVALLAGAPGTAGADDAPTDADGLELEVLSGRPDMVTGGDALVRVTVPRDVGLSQVRVRAGDRDVTGVLEADRGDRVLTGVVTGLPEGVTMLTAEAPGRPEPADALRVTNHPITGPVFSGPQEQPFRCDTTRFTVPVIGGTLGEPLDDDCSIATRVDHFYRTTGDAYAPWPEGATSYPEDMATTTTSEGKEVPFVVRFEHGTVNRSIYEIAMLHDPLREPEPSATRRPVGWNGAAVFTLGLGCANGWYRQGQKTAGVTNPDQLGQGFAVMSSSLNVSTINCSDAIAAEAAMMVKERFVETYGPMTHTIGVGCSGGSYQAHQITDNYPGIFDGIVTSCSFPDVGFATGYFLTDAQLLVRYFRTADIAWTPEQRRAVTGFVTYATATNVAPKANRFQPDAYCAMVPTELRYRADTHPDGVRCGVFDHQVNVYGTDPETGFARRPHDNVGVQYGLAVLNDGTITPEQFLDLNDRVGGHDDDGRMAPERTEADLGAVATAYRTGRLTSGGGGLAEVPIIDHRTYTDDNPKGNIHLRYHTLSMRERLLKANGTLDNYVGLLYGREGGSNRPIIAHTLAQMDRWLTALERDTSDRPTMDKIADARPDTLVEGCWTREAERRFIPETLDRDPGSTCEQLYPSGSFPREVAGADIAADVVKCRLTAPSRDDYAVEWTDEQWARLTAIFPDGVCDWSRPGVEQQPLAGTWLHY